MKKFNQPFKRPSNSPVAWEVNSFLMIIISIVLPFFNNRKPAFQIIKYKHCATNGNYRFKSKPHLFLFAVLSFLSLSLSAQEISATNNVVAEKNKMYGVAANSFQATAFTSLSFPEGNKLEWVPVVNSKKEFEVQRRLENETDFSTIDVVEGKGNGSASVAYSYFDTDVSGAAYYRLKSVDDAGIYYSSVVYANRKSVTLPINVVLCPNPVTGSLRLDFKKAIAGKVDIKLFNLSGKQMPVGVQQSNDFLCSIDVTEILKGAYIVQVKQGKRTYKQRIMIK